MKHFKKVLMALCLICGQAFASDPVDLYVGFVDPVPSTPGQGKSPVIIPSVEIDDHQLLFTSSHPDFTVNIYQNNVLVYSTVVLCTDTEVILPSTLTGEYQILLVPDNTNYYFVGTIVL
jgi:hypothetical protein